MIWLFLRALFSSRENVVPVLLVRVDGKPSLRSMPQDRERIDGWFRELTHGQVRFDLMGQLR